MENLTDKHVGRRLLIKANHTWGKIEEAGVMEVSPSGKYIKIQFIRTDNSAYYDWVKQDEYVLVEELGSVMNKITEAVERFERLKLDGKTIKNKKTKVR
jgi:hypothetical protein